MLEYNYQYLRFTINGYIHQLDEAEQKEYDLLCRAEEAKAAAQIRSDNHMAEMARESVAKGFPIVPEIYYGQK